MKPFDFESSLFKIDIPTGRPHRGSMLVAEPFLNDGYFNHAVVTLIDYGGGNSTMGIVMNRATGYTLGQLIEGFDDNCDEPVFCGGPMSSNRLFFIHRLGDLIPESNEIIPGLWIGGDFNLIKAYVSDGNPTEGLIRFFIGYSGWEKGQLEQEIDEHVWAVTDPLSPKKILTGYDNAYWHKYVRRMGPAYRPWLYHPMNPCVN